MSAQYFIAKTVQDNDYVVLLDSKVVAGPFATAFLDQDADGLGGEVRWDGANAEVIAPR